MLFAFYADLYYLCSCLLLPFLPSLVEVLLKWPRRCVSFPAALSGRRGWRHLWDALTTAQGLQSGLFLFSPSSFLLRWDHLFASTLVVSFCLGLSLFYLPLLSFFSQSWKRSVSVVSVVVLAPLFRFICSLIDGHCFISQTTEVVVHSTTEKY